VTGREKLLSYKLSIRVLGGFTVALGDQVLAGIRSRTVGALLAYLVRNQQAIPREVLAELFWPDRSHARALANLRMVLTRLREDFASHVAITRETVSFDFDAPFWLDAAEFESVLAKVRVKREQIQVLPPSAHAQLEHALGLYRGSFLRGLHVESEAFEEWALLEREHLHLRAVEALDALVTSCAAQNDLGAAIAWSRRLVQLDPYREESHHKLMRLLARSGQRNGALSQYERCCGLLADELGVEPAVDTQKLFEEIKRGEPIDLPRALLGTQRHPAVVPHNLPAQATTFVGRHAEVARFMAQLEDRGCRLLSLIGRGGIGKSRIALALAERALERFRDGVFFVDLSSLPDPTALTTAIAAAVGAQLTAGGESPRDQLLDHLRDRQMLLVLDGFEHLSDAGRLLSDILAVTRDLKVLVTSREPTRLDWEWQAAVEGLSFPEDPYEPGFAAHESVQLFVERARRVSSSFKLAEHRECVGRLCRLVEGMPLAIELAAAWTRTMVCDDILAEILRLESPYGGIPSRHRSLRALFDHSWNHLLGSERAALRGLSVFRGGFRRDAAEAVCGATPPILASLVNKALLSLDHRSGRYAIHELPRVYAAEQLAEDTSEKEHAERRHAAFYAAFLHERDASLNAGDRTALIDVDAEIDNVRAAFAWAAENTDLATIGMSVATLSAFYRIRGWHEEAIAAFESALSSIERVPETSARAQLELSVLMSLTVPLQAVEGYGGRRFGAIVGRAWDICRQSKDGQLLPVVLYYLATYEGMCNSWRTALEIARRLLEIGEKRNDAASVHAAHHLIGIVRLMYGELGTAMTHHEKVVDWYDPIRHHSLAFVYGMSLGVASRSWTSPTLWMLGCPDRALERGREALELAHSGEHPDSVVYAQQVGLSFVRLFRREPEQGMDAIEASLKLATEQALGYHVPIGLLHRGCHLAGLGRLDEGLEQMREAMSVLEATGSRMGWTLFLTLLAEGLGRMGRPREGLDQIAKAWAFASETGERWVEPEVHRVEGELLCLVDDDAGAEHCFQRAIESAQKRQMRGWELRACTSLARLWRDQGKRVEARQALEEVYGWFTEGFDTADLKEARALLEELS